MTKFVKFHPDTKTEIRRLLLKYPDKSVYELSIIVYRATSVNLTSNQVATLRGIFQRQEAKRGGEQPNV